MISSSVFSFRQRRALQGRWPSYRLLVMALLVPVLGLSQVASAADSSNVYYVRAITNKSQSPVRWMKSNCVVLRANSIGSDDISDGSDLQAVTNAVNDWLDATSGCSYLKIEMLEPSPDALPAFDRSGPNENVVYWVESGWRHGAQAAGITTVFFIDAEGNKEDGRILDADIELNGEYFSFTTTGDIRKTDLENALVHEMGHMMGLDHTCDDGQRNPVPLDNSGNVIPSCSLRNLPAVVTEATMYNFTAAGETKKRSPEAGDIAGICETYPLADAPGDCVPVDLSGGGCSVAPVAEPPAERGARWPFGLLIAVVGGLVLTLAGLRRRRRDA